MTAADHADTIREAMHWLPHAYLADCTAALDALQAQAEAGADMEDSPSSHWYYRAQEERERAECSEAHERQLRERAEAAEAERDLWKIECSRLETQVERGKADRDRLADNIASDKLFIKNLLAERDLLAEDYDNCEIRYTALEKDRDRLAEEYLKAQEKLAARVEELVADRDRLADALRRIADGTWTATTGDSISPREYARDALARTEQP